MAFRNTKLKTTHKPKRKSVTKKAKVKKKAATRKMDHLFSKENHVEATRENMKMFAIFRNLGWKSLEQVVAAASVKYPTLPETDAYVKFFQEALKKAKMEASDKRIEFYANNPDFLESLETQHLP